MVAPTYLHTLSVGSFMYGRFDIVGAGRNNLPYNSYHFVVLIIVCYTVPSAHTLADLCCLRQDYTTSLTLVISEIRRNKVDVFCMNLVCNLLCFV